MIRSRKIPNLYQGLPQKTDEKHEVAPQQEIRYDYPARSDTPCANAYIGPQQSVSAGAARPQLVAIAPLFGSVSQGGTQKTAPTKDRRPFLVALILVVVGAQIGFDYLPDWLQIIDLLVLVCAILAVIPVTYQEEERWRRQACSFERSGGVGFRP